MNIPSDQTVEKNLAVKGWRKVNNLVKNNTRSGVLLNPFLTTTVQYIYYLSILSYRVQTILVATPA